MITLLSRQGDVLLVPVQIDLTGAYIKESRSLAFGEMSGHSHVLVGDCDVLQKDFETYVVTHGKSFLAHLKESDMSRADHYPVELQPGTTYQVRLQRQYNFFQGRMGHVPD